MDCFAHLQIRDPEIIDDMIDIVEESGMFGPRWEATMALGRVGAAARKRSAEANRSSIFDSSPQVVALRERVSERIERTDARWAQCGHCCYGRVHKEGTHGVGFCSECLGVGYVLPESAALISRRA
jgi:hypothetical protein